MKIAGSVDQVSQLADLPVADRDGMAVFLQDAARITDGVKEPDSLCRYQGRPAVGLGIMKESGTNTVVVAGQVQGGAE